MNLERYNLIKKLKVVLELDFPAGGPFGAVMEYNGRLYISTNTGNKAHTQLRENGNVQILAKKKERESG